MKEGGNFACSMRRVVDSFQCFCSTQKKILDCRTETLLTRLPAPQVYFQTLVYLVFTLFIAVLHSQGSAEFVIVQVSKPEPTLLALAPVPQVALLEDSILRFQRSF